MSHPFGIWSILPPLVAIILAIATRRVVRSLLIGVAVGAAVLGVGSSRFGTAQVLTDQLVGNLIEPSNVQVFAFTLLMGAMVGVMSRAGGMHGVVDRLVPWAYNRRRGQMLTWAMGLLIFFDDYANTFLVGGTMAPLADRLRISREKLAYIVDSTAAPVAGLALVSTWVAGEIGYIEKGLQLASLPAETDAAAVFLASIPYRFYVLLALAFVPIVAWFGRDFGPMLAAEHRTAQGQAASVALPAAQQALAPSDDTPRRWGNAVLPILVTLGVTLAVLAATGAQRAGADARVGDWITQGDSYLSLVWGSAAGLAAVVMLAIAQRLLCMTALARAALRGAGHMLPALAVLWMAWTLADLSELLETGRYLAEQVLGRIDARGMPTLVFVLASAVAFATGTSWGTMGLLTPLVVPVTVQLLQQAGGAVTADHPVLLATVGGVLAGAIFGDHCSPISDTTVLSSQASGCDHGAHVRTQLPYALLVAAVAIVCGTLPAGFGLPPWPLVLVGCAVLVFLLRAVGKPATG